MSSYWTPISVPQVVHIDSRSPLELVTRNGVYQFGTGPIYVLLVNKY